MFKIFFTIRNLSCPLSWMQACVTVRNMRMRLVQGNAQLWVLPAEPIPVRLMNTIWADRHGLHDSLVSETDLRAWLLANDLATTPLRATSDELARARRLRDALRRLAAHVTRDSRAAAISPLASAQLAVAEVNAATLRGHHTPGLLLDARGFTRIAIPKSARVLSALATVATEAIELFTGESTLRACQAPGCVLYFVKEHPRRQWCSDSCGNRVRAARHYRRHALNAAVE